MSVKEFVLKTIEHNEKEEWMCYNSPCETCILDPMCEVICEAFPFDILEKKILRLKEYRRIFEYIRDHVAETPTQSQQKTENVTLSCGSFSTAIITIKSAVNHIPEKISAWDDKIQFTWGGKQKTSTFSDITATDVMVLNGPDKPVISRNRYTLPVGKLSKKKIKSIDYNRILDSKAPINDSLWTPVVITMEISDESMGDYIIRFGIGKTILSQEFETKYRQVLHNGKVYNHTSDPLWYIVPSDCLLVWDIDELWDKNDTLIHASIDGCQWNGHGRRRNEWEMDRKKIRRYGKKGMLMDIYLDGRAKLW